MFVRILIVLCAGLLAVLPASAQWFDWKETEPTKEEISKNNLKERLAYLGKLEGVQSWDLEGVSDNEVVIRWNELPADHWRIVEGASLMAHEETRAPITLYSVEAGSNWSARSKYLCKVIVRQQKVVDWDGDACGAPKKEGRGLFDNIDLF